MKNAINYFQFAKIFFFKAVIMRITTNDLLAKHKMNHSISKS